MTRIRSLLSALDVGEAVEYKGSTPNSRAVVMLRNIRLLYIHNFLTDFRLHSAFLVIYLAQISGSYTSAMAILALETVTSAVMDIPTGIFSDKIGRKYTLALGSACAALALACYGLAHSIGLLLVAAPLHGLSMCLFNGNNDAMLYESLKAAGKENRFHHDQGRTSSMFQLALGLSALCASFLTNHGLRFLFIVGVIPQILAVLVSLLMKEPRVHMHKGKDNLVHLKTALAKLARNPNLLLLVIGQAISWGAGESNFNFKLAFVNGLWPSWAVALFKASNHVLGFLSFWLAGPLIDRLKAARLLMIAEA